MSAVVAALVLASVAGCSGEPSPRTGGGTPHAERATPVPSEARLSSALAGKSDVRGYRLEDNDQPAVRPKADRSACRALADLTGSGVTRTPAAQAWASRSYGSVTEPGLAVTASLFSYADDGAAVTVAGVRTALKACADGFSTSGNNGGATVSYTSVEKVTAPSGGDEAVAWTMTGEAQGQRMPLRMTAVRHGNVLALFLALHLSDPDRTELPQDLYDAQLRKLDEVFGSTG
ncbi:hypothetical protein [Streptomyces boluensis]|uniref:Uncharacterized protein n=1 Tax=Streptomyces boluensis TaxID=1775135 RepID=A0A964UNU7_9ACTN|nr:hypothetical protein [Streptomyces boluensis]NBE52698.1 hypothetical protein [Streptomyces boluensis]